MKHFVFVILTIIIVSCGKNDPDLIVTGQIKGLKKGTIYLERIQDTALVVLDSIIINGEPDFILEADLDEPEVLYLSLNIGNNERSQVRFFADKGTTTIHTSLKRFEYDAVIVGSKQQKLLDEFDIMVSKFNDKNLELIEESYSAGNTTTTLDSLSKVADNLLKRKYLYAINFAMVNKESEVAPYIAMAEIYDANVKYLDTIYKALPKHIASSKYGNQLADYIKEIKETENQ